MERYSDEWIKTEEGKEWLKSEKERKKAEIKATRQHYTELLDAKFKREEEAKAMMEAMGIEQTKLE